MHMLLFLLGYCLNSTNNSSLLLTQLLLLHTSSLTHFCVSEAQQQYIPSIEVDFKVIARQLTYLLTYLYIFYLYLLSLYNQTYISRLANTLTFNHSSKLAIIFWKPGGIFPVAARTPLKIAPTNAVGNIIIPDSISPIICFHFGSVEGTYTLNNN